MAVRHGLKTGGKILSWLPPVVNVTKPPSR
jgi:hypothetical protein